MANGVMTISKQGHWLNWSKLAAHTIPNAGVFLALVNVIVGVQEG